MTLIEECHDSITFLPFCHFGSDFDDFTCTIGACDYWKIDWERVNALAILFVSQLFVVLHYFFQIEPYLRNHEITIIQ